MNRQQLINLINDLMKPALELGFDWPSTELGFTDPNTASTADLIDFYNELEYFFQYKELEKAGN